MLNKSKSHRSHLLKYALLIPMVFGMLVYTSSYAQDKSQKEILGNQEMSYDQLTEKYYKEIIEMAEKGAGMREIQLKYDMVNNPSVKDKYFKSMDEVAKIKAYNIYSGEEFIISEKSKGTFTNEDQEEVNKVLEKFRTYEDFVTLQKTDEVKELWESAIQDGVLRLVVNDMKNLTKEEEAKRDKKIALIDADDYFHALLMVDGNSTVKMEYDTNKRKNISRIEITEQEKDSNLDNIEVPFSVIDEVPTTEECKGLAGNEEKRICFSNYISDFVNKNFNIKLANELGLSGKQRISVLFKIGKDGNIVNVMARAPHPGLEAEAKRVINSLPQMIPGKQKGQPVIVPYSLPILFQIKGDETPSEVELNPEPKDPKELIDIPFSVVDETPKFKGCHTLSTNAAQKECTTDKIAEFINKNFNTSLAKEAGLIGYQRISVIFKIDTYGNVIDVKSRAASPVLENEAKRVVSSIPKMVPGKHNGKTVVVSYSLPIAIQIGG